MQRLRSRLRLRGVPQRQRKKEDGARSAISLLGEYEDKAWQLEGNVHELMGVEGIAARVYFQEQFNNVEWHGRKPRAKTDYVNATLDIGYTLLFNYMEALLRLYGFDLYVGVCHREFYMRKSLVCDLVEPFHPLIDLRVRKAISLRQCKESDFCVRNGSYQLEAESRKGYLRFLMEPVLDNRMAMYEYVTRYYRCFMAEADVGQYPWFDLGER